MFSISKSKLASAGVALALGFLSLSFTFKVFACGGLFCANSNPVNQTAERIVFAKNGDNTITAAVEIRYEGPAHEFAWVLPVPDGDVEVGVASTQSLDRLQQMTNPQYNLRRVMDDDCATNVGGSNAGLAGGGGAGGSSSAAMGGAGGQGPVQVVASDSVGPYDFVQLKVEPSAADKAEVVVDWLDMNEYDISGIGADLLRGYLEAGMNLIAFRLTKGNSVGAIRPVMLTYPGNKPMIPIKPTAVAANDDMGVMVWVLGEERAVPLNYRDLQLNEAYINWFSASTNYNDVVTAAADEAGGQGFVTEQAGPAANFAEAIYSSFERSRWDQLNTGRFGTIVEFIRTASSSFGRQEGFLEAMSEPGVLPLREGATAEQFVNCPECYFEQNVVVRNGAYPSTPYDPTSDPMNGFEATKVLEALDRLVVGPKRRLRELFDNNPWVTRFYTTLSPDEMTVDPLFGFNEQLPAYSNVHTAVQRIHCRGDVEWHVDLPDGGSIPGDGRTWPFVPGAQAEMPVNLRILQLSENGQEMVVDSAEQVSEYLASLDPNAPVPPPAPTETEAPDQVPPENTGQDPKPTQSDNKEKQSDGTSDASQVSDPDEVDVPLGENAMADSGGCSISGPARPFAGFSLLCGLVMALSLWRRRTTCETTR